MEKERNAGYEIIQKLTVGENHFVLCMKNTTYGAKFATWCSKVEDPTNYFWEHYFDNFPDAQQDLYARALEQSQMINPNHQKRMEEKMPDVCLTTLPSSGELIKIVYKERGFQTCDISADNPAENRMMAEYINDLLSASKAQESAMIAGSMFGWDTPSASPKSYNEHGKPNLPKTKTEQTR